MVTTSSLQDMAAKKHELFPYFVTNDKTMLSIFQYVESSARTDQPVLVTGETGVGKELIAKAIHRLSGRRGNFVPVNVAGLDDNVFSDTLFGHDKGAFTGAERVRKGQIDLAADGTLFLDEIGDMSQPSQVKLLRLLQEGDYLPLGRDEPKLSRCRIVAATNEDLWVLQRAGKFRKDLNFRLRTHHIHIPPLRERKDDIPALVDHFLDKAATALNKKKPTPPQELVPLLQTYSFPGNVRELQSMVFDAVSQHKSKLLSLEVFRSYIAQSQNHRSTSSLNTDEEEISFVNFSDELPTIKEATKLLVIEAMRRANGNQTTAAQLLGISRQALGKRLKNIEEETGSN